MASPFSYEATSFPILDLPPELSSQIWAMAFPSLLDPTILHLEIIMYAPRTIDQPYTFLLGPRERSRRPIKCLLEEQTRDIRVLLALCPATRAMTLRHKPHTLTFETRRTEEDMRRRWRHGTRNDQYAPGEGTCIEEDTHAIVRFNATRDIISIDHGLLNHSQPPPDLRVQIAGIERTHHLDAPPGFGKDIRILRIYGRRRHGEEAGDDLLIAMCPNLRKLYINPYEPSTWPDADLEDSDLDTVFASSRVCESFGICAKIIARTHTYTELKWTVECFVRDMESFEWGLRQAGFGIDSIPEWLTRELKNCERKRAELVTRGGGVRADLRVLPMFSYVLEDFVIMTRRLRDIQSGEGGVWDVGKGRTPVSLQRQVVKMILENGEDDSDRFESAVRALGRTVV